MTTPQFKPVAKEDPAGLDKLLLAAGQGVSRYVEQILASKTGVHIAIWDGPDGLGAILQEHIAAAGVPNKRLPELLTPRAVLTPIIPPCKPKRRIRKVAR